MSALPSAIRAREQVCVPTIVAGSECDALRVPTTQHQTICTKVFVNGPGEILRENALPEDASNRRPHRRLPSNREMWITIECFFATA